MSNKHFKVKGGTARRCWRSFSRMIAGRNEGIAGVAGVEFAFFATILTLLAVSALEFGMGFYRKMQVYDAAQAGAAYVIKNGYVPHFERYHFCDLWQRLHGRNAGRHLRHRLGARQLYADVQLSGTADLVHIHIISRRADQMTFKIFRRDQRGATAVEFALTVPAFLALVFAIADGAMMLWTQLGLQHGAEMAARCAAVNATACGTDTNIKSYAAAQAYGLGVSSSVYTVSTAACGKTVAASYTYTLFSSYLGVPSVALTARSCFPS
jgi:Flp pilus assembly protein TadG